MPMRSLPRLLTLAFAAVLATLAFTAPALAAPGSSGSAWTANGATACEKYLTPDVVAAILRNPAGKPRRLDANSCNVGPIYISLKVADIDVFRAELPRIFQAHSIGGIGDGAYWNGAAPSRLSRATIAAAISVSSTRSTEDPQRRAWTKARRDMQQVVRHPLDFARPRFATSIQDLSNWRNPDVTPTHTAALEPGQRTGTVSSNPCFQALQFTIPENGQ